MDFGRVITAMVTPFDQNLQIDWNRTARLIDYLIEEQQNEGLVISGTTGESPTLSDEERLELFDFAVKHANGRCKIIAGTGSNNTEHSIHLTKEAEKTGVDAILQVAPYYNRPNQEGLYRHFKAIAESTSLPVMLYNIPKRTGVDIAAETTVRLSEIDNIVATKECGTLEQTSYIIENAKDGFTVYTGDDPMTLPVLAIGGHGIVSVTAHVIGREMQEMIRLFFDGHLAEAAKMHRKLMPIFTGLFISPSPGPVKFALQLHGIETGEVRLPLVMPSESERQSIQALFNLK
ncbi:4-hydroxy-tetrahydrodipicolinate synthase [Ferviditalea candida]|uniref:4-hydroxy-tetrahydrodipicolinate synthase n=1 Tax=Ferviditalea candida TaxID=3108399 RepID=A0ABU5ZJD0_9BACL|nr:4-hydroxy-tetrahydrodipicolinate synthase [Paenibacillaceae bacterium T2]